MAGRSYLDPSQIPDDLSAIELATAVAPEVQDLSRHLRSNAANNHSIGIFSETLREVAPLVAALRGAGMEMNQLRSVLAELVRFQHSLVAAVAGSMNMPGAVRLRPIRHKVAVAAGVFISGLGTVPEDPDGVLEQATSLLDNLSGERVIGELATSDEMALSIKLALLPMNINIERYLGGILDWEQRRRILRDINRACLQCARELAFVKAEAAGIEQREYLFSQVLPTVAELAQDVWVEMALGQAASPSSPVSREGLWLRLPSLEEAVTKDPMGHDQHPEVGLDKLKEALANDIWARLEALALPRTLRAEERARLRGLYLESLDQVAAKAWKLSIDEIVAEASAMSDEEFERWSREEGSKPMPLSRYFASFNRLVAEQGGTIEFPVVETQELQDALERRLAMIWGLTDALCKPRTINR